MTSVKCGLEFSSQNESLRQAQGGVPGEGVLQWSLTWLGFGWWWALLSLTAGPGSRQPRCPHGALSPTPGLARIHHVVTLGSPWTPGSWASRFTLARAPQSHGTVFAKILLQIK